MQDYQKAFIELARRHEVLKFGEFTLKSGRVSPYFFNAGAFASGGALAATAIALSDRHGRDVPFAYNRKEAKDHGEGGVMVGAPLAGRVLVIDDVITAGTAVREVIDMITQAGAEPAGVVIGLNRQERGAGTRSAIQEIEQAHGIPVLSIVDMSHIIDYLAAEGGPEGALEAMREYRGKYGV